MKIFLSHVHPLRSPLSTFSPLHAHAQFTHTFTSYIHTMTSNSSDDSSFIEQQQPAVVSLSYNDLVAFSSSDPLSTNESSSSALLLRQSLIQKVGQAFGKDGLGILFITNVPDLSQQRQQLLPLAKAIPTLPNLDSVVHAESLYSTGWSHGKELGDLSKGSYYANPLVEDILEALVERDAPKAQYYQDMAQRHPECYAPNIWPTTSLPQLQTAFLQLGQTIQTTGILLAAICDAYCLQIANVKLNLQETLQRSLNVKGRLLHYFASEPSPTAAAATTIAKDQHYSNEQEKEDANSDVMWCNWHNDHGTKKAHGSFIHSLVGLSIASSISLIVASHPVFFFSNPCFQDHLLVWFQPCSLIKMVKKSSAQIPKLGCIFKHAWEKLCELACRRLPMYWPFKLERRRRYNRVECCKQR